MGLTGVSVGAAFCTGLRGASFWIAGANVVARLRVAMPATASQRLWRFRIPFLRVDMRRCLALDVGECFGFATDLCSFVGKGPPSRTSF